MIANINITVFDGASEPLAAKIRALTPARLAKVTGPRLRELTRAKLASNPSNRRGWPSTGFWEDAARATTWVDNGDGSITIAINKIGVRQRYYGGVITPKNAKALTIPLTEEAYGKTAADFDNLILVKTPKGAYLAQSSYESRGPSTRSARSGHARGNAIKRQRLTFLFKLVGSVNQAANPDIIPTPAGYVESAKGALGEAVAVIVKGGQAS
jgi:hypothetical protein